MEVLGIDIGGSGIKGALVDTEKGELISDRFRVPTPQPSKPEQVIDVIQEIVEHFDYRGPLGVGFPGVVVDGVTLTAANVDDDWIDFPAAQLIAQKTGCRVVVGNDADVAGFAEMRFGAGRGVKGTVMIFTLGTGIGCVMFANNQFVPNLELGHIYARNQKKDAEHQASERARKRDGLSWREWGQRLNAYFNYIEDLFWPNMIIIGGGISKRHKKFLPYIKVRAKVVPAQLLNEAGIIGAAIMAETPDTAKA